MLTGPAAGDGVGTDAGPRYVGRDNPVDKAVRISVIDMTPFYFRLRADDRTMKVNGEMLYRPKGSDLPNHWIARNDISVWEEGSPATESEKDQTIRALHDYAREHGLIFEID